MIHETLEIQAPAIYHCDISRQLMRDPVISVHGYTFERATILKWLALGNNFCPCSGKDMTVHDLISARNLKEEINTWRRENSLSSDAIIGMTLIIGRDHDDLLPKKNLSLDDDDVDHKEKEEPIKDNRNMNRNIRITPLRRMVRNVLRVHPSAA